jgi:hypothetical protein
MLWVATQSFPGSLGRYSSLTDLGRGVYCSCRRSFSDEELSGKRRNLRVLTYVYNNLLHQVIMRVE